MQILHPGFVLGRLIKLRLLLNCTDVMSRFVALLDWPPYPNQGRITMRFSWLGRCHGYGRIVPEAYCSPIAIFTNSAQGKPTKPTEPGFVGFVGWTHRCF